MYRILHLSDLHFGGSHYFRQDPIDPDSLTLGQAIQEVLGKTLHDEPLDCVILSGDLLSDNQSDDVHPAKAYLAELLECLPVRRDRVFAIPGNHDMTWRDDYATRRFAFYDELVDACHLGDCTSAKLPRVVQIPAHDSTEKPLAIALLDSCKIESKDMAGIGRISPQQLRTLETTLERQGISSVTHLLIAVLHHHLLPITPEDKIWNPSNPKGPAVARSSHTVDSVEVLRRLSSSGFVLLLHGHQHRPAILRHANLFVGPTPIYVSAAGSCGAKQYEKDAHTRHFFLYNLEPDTCTVQSFGSSSGNPASFELNERTTKFRFGSSWQDSIYGPSGNVSEVLRRTKTSETLKCQGSDLQFLFMSVVDCPEARRLIRSFVTNLRYPTDSQQQAPEYFDLLGMYDLIGYWDLAVRFRAPETEITKCLAGCGKNGGRGEISL